MDCRESHELMSGAVDNELSKEEASEFYEHIEICGSCKDEFELERMTKSYIRRKITFVDVPLDVEAAIVEQITSYGAAELRPGFFPRLFSSNLLQPALAVVLVVVLAVILVFVNRDNVIMPAQMVAPIETAQSSKMQDALTLAENDFQDVLSGKFKPQITAVGTSDVEEFLERNAGYKIAVPEVRSAEWIGGSVSTFNGIKIAHLLYKMGEAYIYIYSFPKDFAKSRQIILPHACKDVMKSKKWFWGMDSNGDTQAVWCSNDHVYIATANLGKRDLGTFLQERPETGP
ncbi:MAG: zf-HC2 domain-containing protein [Bacteroidetes bacterium]|nr:zf-HC2 domain-containing protein [Bacteroidota bacterium]